MPDTKENTIKPEQEIYDKEYFRKGVFRLLKDLIILHGANADIIEAIEYVNIDNTTDIDLRVMKECFSRTVDELRARLIATGVPTAC